MSGSLFLSTSRDDVSRLTAERLRQDLFYNHARGRNPKHPVPQGIHDRIVIHLAVPLPATGGNHKAENSGLYPLKNYSVCRCRDRL